MKNSEPGCYRSLGAIVTLRVFPLVVFGPGLTRISSQAIRKWRTPKALITPRVAGCPRGMERDTGSFSIASSQIWDHGMIRKIKPA